MSRRFIRYRKTETHTELDPSLAGADLCKMILESDRAIRSVGIARVDGTINTLVHRPGHKPLLGLGEGTSSLIQATVRMLSRKVHDNKLGRTIYSTSVHEKVTRISIPLGEKTGLLLSVERGSDYEDIVSNKILPLLKQKKKHGIRFEKDPHLVACIYNVDQLVWAGLFILLICLILQTLFLFYILEER